MNTLFTKSPIVGTPLTPQVIRQINTAVRRYMPIAGPGVKVSHTAGGSLISLLPQKAAKGEKAKPLPFEVRFDWTLDSESGGWKIYLPTEHLVQYDGTYLDPIGGVTAIQDANGDATGWYSFDELTLQDSHVWLAVTQSGSTVSASFESAQVQEAKENICIAELEYTAATASAPAIISINQSVVGALVITSERGDALEPDDISTETITTPSGQTAGADEGKLQIKGFKTGAPISQNTITDFLQGVAQVPQSGISLVCRTLDANNQRKVIYLPLSALFSSNGISGNVDLNFVGDIQWNTTSHTLQKRVDSVSLKTGQVTQGNWETITNGSTTAISNIPRS